MTMTKNESTIKTFKLEHLFFGGEEIHSETEMPWWLTCKENKWFFDKHVLTLEIGGSVDTDFRRITRVS